MEAYDILQFKTIVEYIEENDYCIYGSTSGFQY